MSSSTLWGISPVWETMCKRSSSFPLNVEEHVGHLYVCNDSTVAACIELNEVLLISHLDLFFPTHLNSDTVSHLVTQKILLPEVPLSALETAKGSLPCVPPMKKKR